MFQKLVRSLGIQQAAAIHMAHQLHNIGLSIYLNITGCHLIKLIPLIFQFRPLNPVLINLSGNTVFTGLVFLPVVIAITMVPFTSVIFFSFIFPSQAKIKDIQKTYGGEYFPVKLHPFLYLLSCQFIA